MSSSPYDPYSTNAMFAKILERLDQQDVQARAHRHEIKESISQFQADIRSTDVRVTTLEKSAWRQRGAVAAIALFIPLLWEFLTRK
jgi:hypothetical protein